MPFVSDLILCWQRRRSGDCHSGALRWMCRSRSCSLSQSRPSRRSLRLPLQHRFQTTTHLRRETLKKTFSASQKPSPTCGNLVRGSSQSRGDRGEQGAAPWSGLQEGSPGPTQRGAGSCHRHSCQLWVQQEYFHSLQTQHLSREVIYYWLKQNLCLF